MSYIKKIEAMTKTIGMSDAIKSDLQKITDQIVKFHDVVTKLNHADEEDLAEMKDALYQSHSYQKAAEEFLDFIKMTRKRFIID